MDNKEILMVVLYIIELVVIGIFYNLYKHWKAKHDDAVKSWGIESSQKDKQIMKLEDELRSYKDMGRTIKVEKVVVQPRELECKFTMHESFIEDRKTFKKIFVSEVARYVAEELENDPCLYKLYFEKSVYNFSEKVIAKLRLLPYPEEANWNLDEENLEVDKILGIPPKIGMGWDKINRLGDYYKEGMRDDVIV